MKRKKKVSLTDIARKMSVSIATVSRALNDSPVVDSRLKLKIRAFAENVGYDRYLRSLEANFSGKMKFIVVMTGHAGSHLTEQIHYGIDEKLRSTNYYELRYLIDERIEKDSEAKKELFINNILSEKNIAGVITSFLKIPDTLISSLNRNNIPVVMLNNYTDFGKCICIDNVKASYNATTKLLELGRKKIGCLIPTETVAQVWIDRLAGYKKALREYGSEFSPELIANENFFAVRHTGIETRKLIDRNPGIDAILFGGDLQAYGGMKMIKDMGLRIPEDISIMGFDDMLTNQFVTPTLASVKQPMFEMGRMGIDMLLLSIERKDYSHEEIFLDTEIKLGGSCIPGYEEEKWK